MYKQIKAIAEYLGNNVYKVSIDDHEAMLSVLQREWCGFTKQEALNNANNKLRKAGYEAVFEI